MRCRQCNELIQPGFKFCMSCGAKIEPEDFINPEEEVVVQPEEKPDTVLNGVQICPNCGRENSLDSLFCEECGSTFRKISVNPEQEENNFPKIAPRRGEIVCGSCGFVNPDSFGFCGRCGVQIKPMNTQMPQGVSCSKCGMVNMPEAVYCDNCGTPLHGGKPQKKRRLLKAIIIIMIIAALGGGGYYIYACTDIPAFIYTEILGFSQENSTNNAENEITDDNVVVID